MPIASPRPAGAWRNDWSRAPVEPLGDFTPAAPVSVVVPYYQTHAETLPKTLAALEGQSYPRNLFEVVIVDDGSEPPLNRPRNAPFKVRVVHQERRGFGLARARNNGARAAAHDILLFLDSDVLAGPAWIAAHARWHHAVADALTVGLTSYVATSDICAETVRRAAGGLAGLLAGRPTDPPRAEGLLRRTNDLRTKDDAVFMAMAGNNFGIRKEFYAEIGGSDESFARWGYEDTELAHRAYVRGGMIAPAHDAVGWHQGRWEKHRNRTGNRIQHEKASHLIAHRLFRRRRPGRVFAVPEFAVTLDAGDLEAERVADGVALLLADRVHDLVVRIVVRDADGDERTARLREAFGADPRVRISESGNAMDDFPASPFHVLLPSRASFSRHVVHRLRARLRNAAVARVQLADGDRVEIARAWALHRARRAGGRPEDFGDLRMLSSRTLRTSAGRRSLAAGARPWREPHPKRRRLADSLRLVESPADAWTWLKWVGYRCSQEARRRGDGLWRKTVQAAESSKGGPVPAVAAVLWRTANRRRLVPWHARHATRAAVARTAGAWSTLAGAFRAPASPGAAMTGETSEPVPSKTDGSRTGRAPHRMERSPPNAAPETARSRERPRTGMDRRPAPPNAAPGAVPPFDARVWNPVRWRRTVGGRVGALGPLQRLPPGVYADSAVRPNDVFALRRLHHVKDVAAFHTSAEARAATLARVAGTGALVHLADECPDLGRLLGEELHSLMMEDPAGLDAAGREALSVRLRRLALRDHSTAGRAAPRLRRAPGAGPRPDTRGEPPVAAGPQSLGPSASSRKHDELPVVSVLLATRRPELLPRALEAVARQTYPRLELVLALHGDGFGRSGPAADLPCPGKTLRFPSHETLGTVLGKAAAASRGHLLAKMDDDDAYDDDHVWDLVLARAYSGAQLVSKGLEFVYLAAANTTVHLHAGRGEDYRTMTFTGGTMLISRRDLARAGGWPRSRRGVDKELVERVLRARGCVYRTHGFGYLMIRRPAGHTWVQTDDYFLDKAETAAPGWNPALAGLPSVQRPPVLGAPGRTS